MAIAELPGRARQRLGGVLLLLGTLAVLGLVLHQAATYLPHVPPGEPTYFAQRCLFALATFADLPLPAVILAGFVLICIPPKRSGKLSARKRLVQRVCNPPRANANRRELLGKGPGEVVQRKQNDGGIPP